MIFLEDFFIFHSQADEAVDGKEPSVIDLLFGLFPICRSKELKI